MNDFKSKVGKLIASRRKELGMTQAELAQKSGYSNKSSIAAIESGIIDVPVSKANDLAKALNVNPSYFFVKMSSSLKEQLKTQQLLKD